MKLLLTATLLALAFFSYSQKKDTLVLDPTSSDTIERIRLPFSGVKVIDARFDKGNVGCMHRQVKNYKIAIERITTILPDSFNQFLPKMINKMAVCSGTDTLVILIKQFRLTEYLVNSVNMNYDPKILLKVSASFFREKGDSLQKIGSIDDILYTKWPSNEKLNKDIVIEYRNESFLKVVQSFINMRNWTRASGLISKKVLFAAIEKRFQLHALTDRVLIEGVYTNFKEFKENNPSIKNVTVEFKRQMPVRVINFERKPFEPGSFWGFCVGNKRYTCFRKKFYELTPTGNSFRFLSYIDTDDLYGTPSFGDYAPQTGLIGAALIKEMDNATSRQYFHLNMDEEEIYLEEIFGTLSLKAKQKEFLK